MFHINQSGRVLKLVRTQSLSPSIQILGTVFGTLKFYFKSDHQVSTEHKTENLQCNCCLLSVCYIFSFPVLHDISSVCVVMPVVHIFLIKDRVLSISLNAIIRLPTVIHSTHYVIKSCSHPLGYMIVLISIFVVNPRYDFLFQC